MASSFTHAEDLQFLLDRFGNPDDDRQANVLDPPGPSPLGAGPSEVHGRSGGCSTSTVSTYAPVAKDSMDALSVVQDDLESVAIDGLEFL